MTRLYHSASSDALGQRCHRAWWYRYVCGLKEPEVPWSSIAHYVADRDGRTWRDPANAALSIPSRARSTALGKEMHARHEARYRGLAVDWHDFPGQVALSGLHFLPQPERAQVMVEYPIGQAAIVGARDAHAPPVGFRVAGILWAGYRDLLARAPEEHARLGIPGEWALYDYKSSADIARYALTPAALATDFAANLYGLASCEELGLEWIRGRWVYFETKRRRYAEPRDAVLTRKAAFEIVAAGSERARALDAITSETSATPNLAACDAYGGCPYRKDLGGPCSAQRSFGQLLQARTTKEGSTMALPPGITQMARPTAVPPNGTGSFTPPTQAFAPPPAAAGAGPGFAPPPAQGFAAPPDAAPDAVAGGTDAAPPPPAAAKKPRAPKAAPPPAASTAQAAAPSSDVYDFEIDGNFGPVTLRGDARDVITAAKILRSAGA